MDARTTETMGRARTERSDVIAVHNPATGELIGEAKVDGAEAVNRVIVRARGAQATWGALSVAERSREVLRFRAELVKRTDEVIDLIVKENGKTRPEALAMEVFPVCDSVTYFAKRAPKILAPQHIRLRFLVHRRSVVHFVPRGVVGVISPWNFPFFIPISETMMALIAGNAVVLKPSEITPLIALKAKEIWDAAGLPKDLFQVVIGFGDTGAALVEGGVNKVVFTGSVATGKRVAAACGARLIPCTLELGGKAPAVVCDDAPIDRTARALVWGAFANSGQVCVSVERAYVPASIHDTLVEKVVALTRELRQGDGATDVDVGAMTWEQQIDRVERQVEEAVRLGARVLTGGRRLPGPGRFFAPTVLVGCTPEMPILREETFGPVLPICKVRSVDEALRLANDSHLGLNAYVFSANRERAEELAVRTEAGSIMVNDVLTVPGLPETPFGGVKESGMGRVNSDDGLRDFCEKRHVNIDRLVLPPREVWWYPYSSKTMDLAKRALRLLYRS